MTMTMISDKNSSEQKIAYVLKRYPRFSETFVVNEILALEKQGMNIDIFALGPVAETHFQDGISKVRASVTRLKDKQAKPASFWKLFLKAKKQLPHFNDIIESAPHDNVHELAQAIVMALEIKKRNIQHLHAHFATRATTVARLAAKMSGITFSFTAHAKDIYFDYAEDTNLGNKLNDAHTVITVSDYNLNHLNTTFSDYDLNVRRIYNGMHLDKFTYSKPNTQSSTILAVGRLVPKKGFSLLVDALAVLEQRKVDFKCVIVGDGPLEQALREQAQALGVSDKLVFTGSLPQPEVINVINGARMMVAPCVINDDDGDRDGLPTVLVESMASGTPVISTKVAGIPELVRDQDTGLCVKANSPEALADAMETLLTDAALCETLSQNARQLIENEFDITKNTVQVRQIFIDAMSSANSNISSTKLNA